MAAVSSIVTALAVAGAGASVAGGMQAQKEGKKQSELAMQQSRASAVEEIRVTGRQKTLEQREIDKTVDRQKLAYLASGVTLEGSPLLKMEETRRLGAENIEEIGKAGEASSKARLAEGRIQAEQAQSRGRQALMSGITGATGSLSRLA